MRGQRGCLVDSPGQKLSLHLSCLRCQLPRTLCRPTVLSWPEGAANPRILASQARCRSPLVEVLTTVLVMVLALASAIPNSGAVETPNAQTVITQLSFLFLKCLFYSWEYCHVLKKTELSFFSSLLCARPKSIRHASTPLGEIMQRAPFHYIYFHFLTLSCFQEVRTAGILEKMGTS